MIRIIAGNTQDPSCAIVIEALRRSVTPGMVTIGSEVALVLPEGGVFVFISPTGDQVSLIEAAIDIKAKIVFFGALPSEIAVICGLSEPEPLAPEWSHLVSCGAAPIYGMAQSLGEVHWSEHPLGQASPIRSRPFLRYDYSDEWNNLGYGRITADGGPWSMAMSVKTNDAEVLAFATGGGITEDVPFVTLCQRQSSSILWWNRAVGPVDSNEWAVIEAFLADWHHDHEPCVPVINEIPFGYDAAITMRLDCDEDIASARPLFELYRDRGIPFSVAVKTAQEDRPDHLTLLADVLEAGGAVLSHSMTHSPRWGGSDEACFMEARGSSDWLEERVEGLTVRYAVSPFHQNPDYVPAALKRARLKGFVGGIIANDPEMLLAKGGTLPGDESGVVTHSQQCMLHGDCILERGDALAINKQAFLNAQAAGNLFGYLDHPFSPRYDYGWGSEGHRLERHAEFIDYIKQEMESRSLLWLNEDDALDWIAAKMRLKLHPVENGFRLAEGEAAISALGLAFSVRWRGETRALSEFASE